MKDPRHQNLARLLVNHSCQLQKGEKVLIAAIDTPLELIEELIAAVYESGGFPSVDYSSERIKRALLEGASSGSLQAIAQWEKQRMQQMDAYIGVRGYDNVRECADLPEEKNRLYMTEIFDAVHRAIRVPDTKWVVLRYPTAAMAMMAGMSTACFEEFYYSVTTGVDYQAMQKAMEPAKKFLDAADRVHIQGPGTDLHFSIKDIPSVPCFGLRNIPDGEIYTAPVKDSVNGRISFNTASTYYGTSFKDICFSFKDGKIIEAQANKSESLHTILDTDTGASYIGEFALGCNPNITQPFDDTLFDEKISGSFHFTPGSAYATANNGNTSAIHWDLVCIQRPDFGGGSIHIDNTLIRDNGIFVHEAFEGLNPEALRGVNRP